MTYRKQRGAVIHPELDGRLKANRDKEHRISAPLVDVRHGHQGRVKNPSTDRRLKQNRKELVS